MILSQGEKNQKLWGGRFQKATDKLVEEFNGSVQFDKRLYRQDIQGSIAHAKMLGKQAIIPQEDVEKIVGGLKEILEEIETGNFEFKLSLEDVHMNIEKRLIDKIGAAGGRLHTARSRNDQVALDSHLYLREEIENISSILIDLQKTIIDVAEAHKEVVMPGYTHLQKAQPILFAHHLMAYFNMLQRDFERLADCYKRVDIMPLGAGALAGTSFPIDREMIAGELGFRNVYHNSLDAVSDRDFMLEFLSCASILMVHLSRFSEEIILWASSEFSFIDLDDAYSTGSSIMPQKKNPDVAELTRGKTGRVFGNLMSLLTVMKGLPLAYNKDMQEDKEPLFDTVDTIKICLSVFTGMLATLKVNKDRMLNGAKQGFTNATDVADYLVKKGLPFRQAHEVVGKLVYYCVVNNKSLDDLSLGELREFSTDFTEDILEIIKVENCVAARNVLGGTAQKQVWQEIERGKAIVENNIAVWN